MRCRRLRFVVVTLAAAVAAGVFSQASYGITWCFDWVAYEINGNHDTNRNSAGTLIKLLEERGYKAILEVRASTSSAAPGPQDIRLAVTRLPPPAPQVATTLKPGDVLIFGNAHTGIVRSTSGKFDHFLQDPASEGTALAPEEVAKQPNYFVGPEKSWTLQQFFAVSRDKPPAYSHDFDPRTWAEWLGRSVLGAPKQYPFLGTTAVVYRAVSTPATAPTPPTISTLTATLHGSSASLKLGWGAKDSLIHTSGMNQYIVTAFQVHPGDLVTFQEQFDQPLPAGSTLSIAVGQGSLGAGAGTPGYTVIKKCASPASICKVSYTIPPHPGGGNEMTVNAYVTSTGAGTAPYTNSFYLIYAGLG